MSFVERVGRSAVNRIASASPDGADSGRMRRLFRLAVQYAKFGTVGLSATAVHVLAFTLLIELAGWMPLLANLASFSVAVLVSFLGHFHWTFRPGGGAARRRHASSTALSRFAVVALTGLCLNSLAVHVVVNVLVLPYAIAIAVMVFFVPVVLFAMNKLWAFA